MPVKIKITIELVIPLYKKLAPRIQKLKALGMTNNEISDKLGISRKTIRKALSC